MNELSKNLKCLRLKSGVEIWAESERLVSLESNLPNIKNHFFIRYDEETINTAEIEGIFTPRTMDEFIRRKNGEWKCQKGNWHSKREKCECVQDKICPICKLNKADTRSNAGMICFDCYKEGKHIAKVELKEI